MGMGRYAKANFSSACSAARDFFWRQLAAEYACDIINCGMTEDEVLRDIGRANMIIVKYVTEVCQRILAQHAL
jgi:hypothetical protein